MLVIWYFKFAKTATCITFGQIRPAFPVQLYKPPLWKGGREGDNTYGEGQVMTNDTYVR